MGGWGWRGGCWTALPQQGLSQGSVHLGEEGRSHRGSTWLHVAHTNSHSFIHPLENADSEALTRWCGVRREEGRGSLRFLPVQVVRTSLTRPVETGGGVCWGVREPRDHWDQGSLFSSLSTPHSQLSASWFVPLPDSPEDWELLRAGPVCGTPVPPALLLNEQDSEPSAQGTEPLFHSGERRREFQG